MKDRRTKAIKAITWSIFISVLQLKKLVLNRIGMLMLPLRPQTYSTRRTCTCTSPYKTEAASAAVTTSSCTSCHKLPSSEASSFTSASSLADGSINVRWGWVLLIFLTDSNVNQLDFIDDNWDADRETCPGIYSCHVTDLLLYRGLME